MIFICVVLILAAGIAVLLVLFGGTDLHVHRKVRGKEIRVACVGDSITNGALIPNCFANSYPAKLQKLLGENYHVENYGLNDRTVQRTADKPYCSEKEYRLSLAFQPDIVVVILGTNDTKPANWRSQESFAAEYRSLLNSWLDLESKPQVILCTPPWAMAPLNRIQSLTNDTDASKGREIADAVMMIGGEYSLTVIDLYALFEGKRDLLGPDRLHPNTEGAELIAERIYRDSGIFR